MKRGPGSSLWKCWDVGLPGVRFAIQALLSCLCRWGGGMQTLEPGGPGLGIYLGLQAWKEAFSEYEFVPKAENTRASSPEHVPKTQ